MEKIGHIYKITSPSNKVYIGQSINLSLRIYHYRKLHCKKQAHLYNSILKYGWSEHKFEVLESISKDSLNEREAYWIEFFDSFKNGMNLTSGGDNYILSEESKMKISKANSGENNGMFGRVGELHPRYNQKASTETIEKLKVSHLGKMTGKNNSFYKGLVICYKDGIFVGEFEGVVDAANKLNLHHPNISKVIKGKRKKLK
jgi:group I intron endonuclease